MSTILAPLARPQFFDNDGAPAVGYQLFTYLADSSTKTPTYTDFTGNTANTNPIVLDDRGEASIWLNPLLSYKFVFAPPTDTDPPTDPIWTVDDINDNGNPLVIRDASLPQIELIDNDANGVSLAYGVGDGLFQIAPVVDGVTGTPVVTIDPIAQTTASITTPDPFTISSDSTLTLTSGQAFTLEAGNGLSVAVTGISTFTGDSNMSFSTSGGTLSLQSAGLPLSLAGFSWPTADGAANAVLTTDGAGNLSFQTGAGSGSFDTDGYVILGGNLMDQWGRVHQGDIAPGNTTTITFPQPFEGGVFNFLFALQTTGFGGVPSAFLTSLSTTQAVITWYEDFPLTEDITLHWRCLGLRA